MSDYRSSDAKYPYLSNQILDGVPFRFMMTNPRSENWYPRPDGNREYLDLIREGDHVIDCGANEGYIAILSAMKAGALGKVLAIEPGMHNIEPLRINLALNNLSARVEVLHAAVGEAVGEIGFCGEIVGGPATVPMVNLDSFMEFDPDVIKLDVEGYELKALLGAREMLRKCRPVVFLEAHLSGLAGVDMGRFDSTPVEILELLRECDYEVPAELLNQAHIIRPRRVRTLKTRADLVVTLAFGDASWQHAKIMTRSLRKNGRYDGEIHVYSDREDAMEGATVIESLDVRALPSVLLGKPFLGKDMDVSSFRKVVLLDADILVTAPVKPLLDWPHPVAMPTEGPITALNEDWFWPKFEPARHDLPSLNTGTIICSAALWNSICQRWWHGIMQRELWKIGSHGLNDQPMMNYLVYSGGIPVGILPVGMVRFMDTGFAFGTIMVHMKNNPDKTTLMNCLESFRANLEPMSPGDSIDRYTILILKRDRLGLDVDDEVSQLRHGMHSLDTIEVQSLAAVNRSIWDLEADIRQGKEGALGLDEVGRRALAIRDLNAKRIALKNQINERLGYFQEIKGQHASSV